jgi:hypothetical protein
MVKKYDLTIKDVSAILSISISTVRRLIKRGQLSKRYERTNRGRVIMLMTSEVNQLKAERDKKTKTTEQMISIDRYLELEHRYIELQKRHEALSYQFGAIETRYRELETEAQSLKEQRANSLWSRIKGWWLKKTT